MPRKNTQTRGNAAAMALLALCALALLWPSNESRASTAPLRASQRPKPPLPEPTQEMNQEAPAPLGPRKSPKPYRPDKTGGPRLSPDWLPKPGVATFMCTGFFIAGYLFARWQG